MSLSKRINRTVNPSFKWIFLVFLSFTARSLWASMGKSHNHPPKENALAERYSDCRIVFPKDTQICTVHCTQFPTLALGNRVVCSAELENAPADGITSLFSGAFDADKGGGLAARLKQADKHALDCGCIKGSIENVLF